MYYRTQKRVWLTVIPALCLVVTVTGISLAGSVQPLTQFAAGTVASADEVNANFAACEVAINDNDARIAAAETQLGAINILRPRYAIRIDINGNIVRQESTAGLVGVVTSPFTGRREIELTNASQIAIDALLDEAFVSVTLTSGIGRARATSVQIGTLSTGNRGIIVDTFSTTNEALVNHGIDLVLTR